MILIRIKKVFTHPLPHRSSEIIVRRKLVQESLDILISRGLVSPVYKNTGVFYSANKSTSLFVNLLKSTYFSKLTLVVEWVLSKYGNVSTSMLNKLVNENIHFWGGEFEYEALVRSTYEQ
ncbi:ABC-three component system middle component 2 [Lysinibacillus xylanilyticus]|uniref:ABC-three component system middle component 2 n=1 Tax=Lysinibacillus xylanilyticus TaxID=582475 RepID=UPI0034A0D118